MFARAVDTDLGQQLGIVLLVLVHEDLEDVGGGQQLGEHDPLGGLVRAHLVDGRPTGHSECHHDPAVLLLDDALALDPEVLEPGNGTPDHLEPLAVTRAGSQLVDRFSAHVVAGEHGVDDADAIHAYEPTGAVPTRSLPVTVDDRSMGPRARARSPALPSAGCRGL